ncbi:MFS transporter [Dactylosporangium aurantiacum]|uniref:MFS transporter n=1 Tax=Dactylosporangium aurantiacum TaxID=35754 RepID=A0A9Q9IK25_9ACTN|nr:MFS transporter [Dactylosporangium aurantiacum]MDG6103087.1 MFS transporter [Dactylosporangium aurantiacum]UWZ57599.1 MFS transporter [Dactylosporangium aurantiacum]
MSDVRLPLRGLIPFATGSVGMGVWVTVPGLLLLYFLTDVLAVPPLLAGFVLLAPKILDVVLHPWVGRLSDADLAARGHRRRLMLAGCALAVAFAALFAVPGGLRGAPAGLWVAIAFIAGNLLFAAYQVPYLATPADLSIGYHERTRLMGYRMVVLTVGILLSGVAAPLLAGQDDPTVAGYTRMGLLLGAAMLAAMLVGVTGVGRLTAAAPLAAAARTTRHGLLSSLRDPQFRTLTAAYLAMSTTTHLVLAAVPYFAEYELGRPRLTTVLVAAFVAPAILATPVWVVVARRIGKQRGLLLAQAAFVAGSLVLALGAAAGLPLIVGAVAVLGVAFAAMQLLPFSMVPDVIAASGPDGTTRAGGYTGVWTATEATGGALGPYVYAACLAAGGFVASGAGEHATQSPAALAAVRYGFALVPAVLMTVAVVLQRRYTLDGRR